MNGWNKRVFSSNVMHETNEPDPRRAASCRGRNFIAPASFNNFHNVPCDFARETSTEPSRAASPIHEEKSVSRREKDARSKQNYQNRRLPSGNPPGRGQKSRHVPDDRRKFHSRARKQTLARKQPRDYAFRTAVPGQTARRGGKKTDVLLPTSVLYVTLIIERLCELCKVNKNTAEKNWNPSKWH